MNQHFIVYKTSKISYYQFGTGIQKAICLHGYDEDATRFFFLEKYAGHAFTFFSIDLPFHGQTQWNEGLTFTHEDLQAIIHIIVGNSTAITLLGFSMGGRVALSLYESSPDRIKKMMLLAPDGLKVNTWYWLATQIKLGNRIFSYTMKHPGWFFTVIKLFNKLKLVNASIVKFVNYYIGNKEIRLLLYQRWTTLRKLKPHHKKIKSLIREHKTDLKLIYGKYDRIIPFSLGEKFQKGIESYCTVSVINAGHQLLHEKHVQELVPHLLN
jgi:pimeloyl-ACP methyl ester carboxylesterase